MWRRQKKDQETEIRLDLSSMVGNVYLYRKKLWYAGGAKFLYMLGRSQGVWVLQAWFFALCGEIFLFLKCLYVLS